MLNESDNDTNGLNESTLSVLWGLDADQNLSKYPLNLSTNESLESDLNSLNSIQELAISTDIPLSTPPRAASVWTKEDYKEWEAGNDSNSRFPTGAALENSRFGTIKDAHASFYSVTPSTIAYVNGSSPTRYIGSNGEVRATVDYRIQKPENRSSNKSRTLQTLKSHQIEQVCLLEVDTEYKERTNRPCSASGGSQLNSVGGTHKPVIPYSTNDVFGSGQYVVVAEIVSQINRTVQAKEINVTYKTVNTTDGKKTVRIEEEEWVTKTQETRTDRVVVTDSFRATVYDLQRSQTRTARTPNGRVQSSVLVAQPVNGFEFLNSTVSSPWSFYTKRNTDWDSVEIKNESGTYTVHSQAHPLEVYAFNGGGSYSVGYDEDVPTEVVAEIDGRQKNLTADIPDNFAVSVVANYTAKSGLVVGTQTPLLNDEVDGLADPTIRVRPLVRGMGKQAGNLSNSESLLTYREANITTEVLKSNNRFAKAKITLTDNASGDPIDTSEREGYLIVNGEKVETNASGIAIVSIPRASLGYVTYKPAKWYEVRRAQSPYKEANGYITVTHSILEPSNLLGALSSIVLLFLPMLLVMWALNGYLGANLWPPWHK